MKDDRAELVPDQIDLMLKRNPAQLIGLPASRIWKAWISSGRRTRSCARSRSRCASMDGPGFIDPTIIRERKALAHTKAVTRPVSAFDGEK